MFANWKRSIVLFTGALLLVALGFAFGTSMIGHTVANSESLAPVQAAAAQSAVMEQERLLAEIYNRVSPSVVSINVTGATRRTGFFESSGTGFVIDTLGHIITNNHVVDGADEIEVNFFDGTIVRGDVIGLDPDSDLAVLRVNLPADRLRPITFGDSNELFIGQTALAIGSPFGQRWTLTSGIISALDRTIQGLTQFTVGAVIQTDAAINPGNSGGPLLNLRGEVIGVNSQIISETRSNSGIGFAVPSNLVRRVAEELISDGRVNYSYLGISSAVNGDGRDMTLATIETLGLPNNMRGIVVESVVPGSPADMAGLRNSGRPVEVKGQLVPTSADIIVAVDRVPMTGMSSLVAYLATSTLPGQVVVLTVWRDGQFIDIPVTLGSRR